VGRAQSAGSDVLAKAHYFQVRTDKTEITNTLVHVSCILLSLQVPDSASWPSASLGLAHHSDRTFSSRVYSRALAASGTSKGSMSRTIFLQCLLCGIKNNAAPPTPRDMVFESPPKFGRTLFVYIIREISQPFLASEHNHVFFLLWQHNHNQGPFVNCALARLQLPPSAL
jgi:hypothetical protein